MDQHFKYTFEKRLLLNHATPITGFCCKSMETLSSFFSPKLSIFFKLLLCTIDLTTGKRALGTVFLSPPPQWCYPLV